MEMLIKFHLLHMRNPQGTQVHQWNHPANRKESGETAINEETNQGLGTEKQVTKTDKDNTLWAEKGKGKIKSLPASEF